MASSPVRFLPQAADAEQGILSSILLHPEYAFEQCDEKGIVAEAFHIPAHAIIYGVLARMHAERQQIDLVTVTNRLRDDQLLDQVGGPAYVTELCTYLPTAANVGHYAGIVEEKATLRQIITVCTEHVARTYEEQDNVAGLIDGLESRVFAIGDRRYKGDTCGITEIAAHEGTMRAIEIIEELNERKGRISGLATGFQHLDQLIDGLHPGELFVIGARPSMGKTALLMDIALHAAIHEGARTAIFSAEMSAEQLYLRAIGSLASVNLRKIRDGMLVDGDFSALTRAATKLAKSPLVILDAVGATINAVRARTRRLHRKQPLGLVVVDYLQKLRHPPAAKVREREISEVSEGLKNLARDLSVPLVTAAQINRAPDSRSGEARGVPRMSDLRESGSIEQDADVVALLHRPEQYANDANEKESLEGRATLDIAKQRNGPLGEVRLTFLKDFTRFEDRAVDEGKAGS